MAAHDGGGGHGDAPVAGAAIERLTRALALAGGALLLVTVGITVASVAGRYFFGVPISGDYEMVEIVCAVAVFLFFPYTHATNANLVAEFFTSAMSPGSRRFLDVLHDLAFAAIAALLTWRLGTGLIEKYKNGDMTMMIQIPFWWAYSFAVLSMALLTVVCLCRAADGIGKLNK